MKFRLAARLLLVCIALVIVVVSSGCEIIYPGEPAVLSVNPRANRVTVGKKFKFKIDQLNRNGENTDLDVRYRSLNPGIATVDKDGVVTARKPGDTKIEIICGDKSATSEISVFKKGVFMLGRQRDGVIADNGTVLLQEVGGLLGTGHVTNMFDDNKTYWQIMYSIKNISNRKIFLDPGHFVMIGDKQEVIQSSNKRLNSPELFKAQWLEAGKTIERALVVFPEPHADFDFGKARIIYNDNVNSKIIYHIGHEAQL